MIDERRARLLPEKQDGVARNRLRDFLCPRVRCRSHYRTELLYGCIVSQRATGRRVQLNRGEIYRSKLNLSSFATPNRTTKTPPGTNTREYPVPRDRRELKESNFLIKVICLENH